MPHRVCLLAVPELIPWMAATDLLIAAAYIAIPAVLHVYARASGVYVPRGYRLLIYGFEVFIGLCGLTHLMDAVTLWWPLYRLEAGVNVACAATSLVVAYALARSVPGFTLEHWRAMMERVSLDRRDGG